MRETLICILSFREEDRWCLVSSQTWTGSDIIYPDCAKVPTDPSCTGNGSSVDPANERLANLYGNDVVSNSLTKRLNSSY